MHFKHINISLYMLCISLKPYIYICISIPKLTNPLLISHRNLKLVYCIYIYDCGYNCT